MVIATLSVAIAPYASFSALPEPYLFVRDAPLTRNLTVDLIFVGHESLTADRLASNSPEIDTNGRLKYATAVAARSDWTLQDGAEGPRTVYGQLVYNDGSLSDVFSLGLYWAPGANSLYVDVDPGLFLSVPSSFKWHQRTFTPNTRIFGTSTSTSWFSVFDSSYLVSFSNANGPLTVGVHTVGPINSAGDCTGWCAAVTKPESGSGCAATTGTYTVHAIEFAAGSSDIKSADVDFNMACGNGRVISGSVRYGSSRGSPALDQNDGPLQFGSSAVGEAGATRTATITNIGDIPHRLGQATVGAAPTESAPADFDITTDSCSNAELAVGASCTVDVEFTAGGQGGRRGVLTIPDNTARGKRSYPLLGQGLIRTTLDMEATKVPTHAPGVATFVITLSPVAEPFTAFPGITVEGPGLVVRENSTRLLTNPPRSVLTYSFDTRPGNYKVTASFATCCGYIGAASESIEFTVGEDVVAPSGTLEIEALDGSTDYTTSRQVTLRHPAADNSVVTGMAVSNDGETWEHGPYQASRTWFLPPSNGTHTVYVKWYDEALNPSAVVTDTIVLDSQAPFVTGPGQEFVQGTGIVDGKVVVAVPWSGEDATSGIADFDLAQRTDSGAWKLIAAPAAGVQTATSHEVTRRLAPQHAYTFRVRATDSASNRSTWTVGTRSSLKRLQESNTRIRYSRGWRSVSATAFWGGAAKRASTYGATATLTFTGRSFAWVARTGRDRGEAIVYIDGRHVKTVDLYSATASNKRVVFAYSWDDAIPRTVQIMVVGTGGRPTVEIDALLTSE